MALYTRRCRRCNEAIGVKAQNKKQFPIPPRHVSEKLDDVMEEHLLFCGNNTIVPEDRLLILEFYRELRTKHRKENHESNHDKKNNS